MKKIIFAFASLCLMTGCQNSTEKEKNMESSEFNWVVDRFDDIEVIRYRVNDFESLTAKQKELIYYLSEDSVQGRDILFDQNNRWNLAIRRTLESIYQNFNGDKESEQYKSFEKYLKKVWFANGIHHHYSTDKFTPEFSKEFFVEQVNALPESKLPLQDSQTKDNFITHITEVIFNPTVYPKGVNQTEGEDLVVTSANKYQRGVPQKEVEDFDESKKDPKDHKPVMWGMNSRVVKNNGKVEELVLKVDGLYTEALEKVVYWLEKAEKVAETSEQKIVLQKLISYYKSGCLKEFDDYAISWVYDLNSQIDFVNGFTESYGDLLGMKA